MVVELVRLLSCRMQRQKRTDTTVVRALRTWEATLWPAVRTVIHVKESVFLFDAEPWLLISGLVHDLFSSISVVGSVEDDGISEGWWQACRGRRVYLFGEPSGSLITGQ